MCGKRVLKTILVFFFSSFFFCNDGDVLLYRRHHLLFSVFVPAVSFFVDLGALEAGGFFFLLVFHFYFPCSFSPLGCICSLNFAAFLHLLFILPFFSGGIYSCRVFSNMLGGFSFWTPLLFSAHGCLRASPSPRKASKDSPPFAELRLQARILFFKRRLYPLFLCPLTLIPFASIFGCVEVDRSSEPDALSPALFGAFWSPPGFFFRCLARPGRCCRTVSVLISHFSFPTVLLFVPLAPFVCADHWSRFPPSYII